jgi:hypothetical protein
MKKCLSYLLKAAVIGVLSSLQPALAQEARPGMPLNVSVFSEAWALPSSRLVKDPFHPGAYVSTEHDLGHGRHSRFYLTLGIGYYYHRHVQHGIFVNLNAAYAYQFGFGLYSAVSLGLGAINTIYPTPVYKLKEGEYKKSVDWGKVSLMPNADFTLGYTFNQQAKRPFSVFTKYQVFLEYPYAPANTFPALPHTAFHLGTRFYPFSSR